MSTSAASSLVTPTLPASANRRTKPVTPASQRRQILFDLTSEAVVLAAHTFNVFLEPQHIFRSSLEGLQAVDKAFAASLGQRIELVPSVQRLPDGRVTGLITPQLVDASATARTGVADFFVSHLQDVNASVLVDLEVEIYLRTDEDRLIDLLDFSEISEEADEDGYVVGYVALANLLRHQDTLRKYGAFLVRTGGLRPVSADGLTEAA